MKGTPMNAAQINKYGDIEAIEVTDCAIMPTLERDQVLVKVAAASLNPFDWKLRSGMFKDYIPLDFPLTLCGDFSGVVTQIGEDVTELHVGNIVYGQGGAPYYGTGALAEYIAAKCDKVAQKPKNVNFIQAAALPLAGISALQALEHHINLQNGQKILIHGGAGGIGSMAIQIAKAIGAYVATTVSPDDMEFVKGLGADEVIDYKSQTFEKMLQDYDAVFDTAGGETTNKSFAVLKKGCVLVSMVQQPDPALAEEYGVTALFQNTDSTPTMLKRLAELVEEDKLKVQVDQVFALAEIQEAFRLLEHQSPRGKVVVSIHEFRMKNAS